MQCREFREISEAYLSEELLVETNIQVLEHLENCPKCRGEFAAKRRLRQKLCAAVKNAPEVQVDPVFASRLAANLRQAALRENDWRSLLLAPKFLIPVMASLLVFATLGLFVLNHSDKTFENAPSVSQNNFLTQLSLVAVDNHLDCALEKLPMWEKMSEEGYAEKAFYAEKIVKPLRENFSDELELLHAHECIFEGKKFRHVILRKGARIVSIFFDESDTLPKRNGATNAAIICEKRNGLQVASFQKGDRAIFVVSDLTEAENLSLARALSALLQTTRI